jgi:3-hydroxy-9,10-secoandrosta-1,3,5(10)-triene-9,17-dione monooxygenase
VWQSEKERGLALKITLDRPSATEKDRELRAKLVSRAAELVPLLTANAERTEREGRVTQENVDALEQAGLLSLTQPHRYGGLETDIRTLLEVSAELARGCGATSWVMTLLNVCSWFTALFSQEAQENVWSSSPSNRVAGSLTPGGSATAVEGGYLVSGKWAWASGAAHAQWAIVAVPVIPSRADSGQAPSVELMVIPMSELSIENTWFMAGMSGTGSNTVVGDQVFVPKHRCVLMSMLADGEHATPFIDETLYRAAFLPVALVVLAAPQLGLAQAALDLVLEEAPRRAHSGTFYAHQSDGAGVQLDLAEAASMVSSAHLHLYSAAAEIDEWAHHGAYPDYLSRTRIRMDTGVAAKYAREAIRRLVSVSGASSFATANPLQRIWRDSEVASRHTAIRADINAELYGKALLGLPERISPLV